MTLRNLINRFLGPAGYRLERRSSRLSGRDLHGDIDIILGRRTGYRILDLGANEGQSVRHFLRDFRNPDIIAFEPGPRAVSLLKERFGNNPRVRIVPNAVGESDGAAFLNIYAQSEMNSLLPLDVDSHSAEAGLPVLEQHRVDVVSLDSFAAQAGIDQVDLLKIDCQGGEMGILRGARRLLTERRIKCLYLEVMFKPLYRSQSALTDYVAFLEPHGFDLTGFYRPALRQTALFHADVLFTRRDGVGPADPITL